MSKWKNKIMWVTLILMIMELISCSNKFQNTVLKNENTKEGIAIVTNVWWNRDNIIDFKIIMHDNTKAKYSESFFVFGSDIVVGSKYKVYYDDFEPYSTFKVDFTKPLFEGYEHSHTFCYIKPVPLSANKGRNHEESIWEINYLVLLNNQSFKSSSFFPLKDFNRKDIVGYWYKTKYATSNPAFSQLQIDTPYTTKENTDLKIIDIGDKTTRELNRAARKLKSGGVLYWTTSNIDLSDEAEINQEELNKMNQFLETYELKGFLGRKLDIKVEIVDHRNIGEVLVPVEREKIEE